MHKFSRRVLNGSIFCLIGSIFIILLISITPLRSADYFMHLSFEDKTKLLKTTPSPKIVIQGGSNTMFGFDSEFITYKTGHSVVNMGVRINFSLKFILDQLKQAYFSSGDVVILSLEYQQYGDLVYGEAPAIYDLIIAYPQGLIHLSHPKQHSMVGLVKFFNLLGERIIKHKKVNDESMANILNSMNSHGDRTNHLSNKYLQKPVVCLPEINTIDMANTPDAITMLNKFQSQMEEIGVKVVIALPPIPQECYVGDVKQSFDQIVEVLQNQTTLPILGPQPRYSLPLERFYNTAYHVDVLGRQDRTAKVIKAIGPFLDKSILAKQSELIRGNPLRDAEIGGINIPKTVKLNESISMDVIIKNTGQSTWSYYGGYNLLIRSINSEPIVASLEPTTTILPGEEYTFKFDFIAPGTPGRYNLSTQMHLGRQLPFGEANDIHITVLP